MKYSTINGWTKEKMKAQIRAKNNGTRCYDSEQDSCVYEMPNGNHCAVGCFIPQGHEGMTIIGGSDNLLYNYQSLTLLMPLKPRALRELQKVHDSCQDGKYARDVRDVLCEWIDANVVDYTEKVDYNG